MYACETETSWDARTFGDAKKKKRERGGVHDVCMYYIKCFVRGGYAGVPSPLPAPSSTGKHYAQSSMININERTQKFRTPPVALPHYPTLLPPGPMKNMLYISINAASAASWTVKDADKGPLLLLRTRHRGQLDAAAALPPPPPPRCTCGQGGCGIAYDSAGGHTGPVVAQSHNLAFAFFVQEHFGRASNRGRTRKSKGADDARRRDLRTTLNWYRLFLPAVDNKKFNTAQHLAGGW